MTRSKSSPPEHHPAPRNYSRLTGPLNPLSRLVRLTIFKFLGIAFLLLTLFIAWRTRRDLAKEETQWGRALFQRSAPIRRHESPLRYWLATLLNVAVVILFALAGVLILRVGILRMVSH